MSVTPIPKEEWEQFKHLLAENKQKSLERCARVKKPPTNADRIRAMSDEELAIWLSAIMDCSKCIAEIPCAKEITTKFCKDILRDWLKSPVEEEK